MKRALTTSKRDLTVDASYAIFWGTFEPHLIWWVMSREAILRMCRMAGFARVEWKSSFTLTPTKAPQNVGTMGIVHAFAP